MANRDFRKNLALLCALAGGATALSSINVPTSAMEELDWEKMQENNKKLINDFQHQYDYGYNTLAGNNGQWENQIKYERLIHPLAATTLNMAITGQWTKSHTLGALDEDMTNLASSGNQTDSTQVLLLIQKLESTGINWAKKETPTNIDWAFTHEDQKNG